MTVGITISTVLAAGAAALTWYGPRLRAWAGREATREQARTQHEDAWAW